MLDQLKNILQHFEPAGTIYNNVFMILDHQKHQNLEVLGPFRKYVQDFGPTGTIRKNMFRVWDLPESWSCKGHLYFFLGFLDMTGRFRKVL